MLHQLLQFLLQAKSGVLAGVFLVGATGALVTATVEGGVTTITITQASASPSASVSASPSTSPSASPSTSPSASPSTSPSASPSTSPSASPSGSPSAECRDAVAAVQTVNTAFSQYHTDLEHLRQTSRTESARDVIAAADEQLRTLRQNAVKAIHDASQCGDKDTENEQDQDNGGDHKGAMQQANFIFAFFDRLFGEHTNVTVLTASASPTATATATSTATATTTTAPSGDLQQIADDAVAAMKLAYDDAVAAVEALPSASPRPTHGPQNSAGEDHRSNDHGRSSEGGDD